MHKKTPPLDCDFYFNGNKQQKKIDNNKTLLIINKKNHSQCNKTWEYIIIFNS